MLALAQEPTEYKLQVSDFNELTVVDGINVDYISHPDSAGYVVFTATPELADQVTFSNSGSKLTIQTTAYEHPIVGMPKIRVYSTMLRSATNSGDSTLRILSVVTNDKFKVKEMGNGRIEAYGINADEIEANVDTGAGTVIVEGTVRKANLRNVGTGTLDASSLNATEAKIFVFGSGPVDANVTTKMSIYGIGPGKVRLHRHPEKISNRSIGVKTELL